LAFVQFGDELGDALACGVVLVDGFAEQFARVLRHRAPGLTVEESSTARARRVTASSLSSTWRVSFVSLALSPFVSGASSPRANARVSRFSSSRASRSALGRAGVQAGERVALQGEELTPALCEFIEALDRL
jgi:hypothetical protein